ncbi:MAG: 3-phosphoshikimate 1-carboxyvinyltransferase [Bacteroidales bacterium]|nr:3-phosphoshikimate 1-carboxyvinyltransferase [Bacteroidales bacterium]
MIKTLNYRNTTLRGQWIAPSSKSYLQRALVLSFLSKGKNKLGAVSWCDDSLHISHLLEKLNCKIKKLDNTTILIDAENVSFRTHQFNIGETGLGLRMMSPILSSKMERFSLSISGSLVNRPTDLITNTLLPMGVKINKDALNLNFEGKLKAGKYLVDGTVSSQLLTGLLMAMPTLDGSSQLQVNGLKSKSYIAMTLDLMKHFGVEITTSNLDFFDIKGKQVYKPAEYEVEGDWSAAAYFVVLAAIKSSLSLRNLNRYSLQPDRRVVDVIKQSGAKVLWQDDVLKVSPNRLEAFEIDVDESPDLVPPLAVLAAFSQGTSVFKNVDRLKYKESDRLFAVRTELAKIGVRSELVSQNLVIEGLRSMPKINHIQWNSYHDHRIAMMGAILSVILGGSWSIEQSETVSKSYPSFFEDLDRLIE